MTITIKSDDIKIIFFMNNKFSDTTDTIDIDYEEDDYYMPIKRKPTGKSLEYVIEMDDNDKYRENKSNDQEELERIKLDRKFHPWQHSRKNYNNYFLLNFINVIRSIHIILYAYFLFLFAAWAFYVVYWKGIDLFGKYLNKPDTLGEIPNFSTMYYAIGIVFSVAGLVAAFALITYGSYRKNIQSAQRINDNLISIKQYIDTSIENLNYDEDELILITDIYYMLLSMPYVMLHFHNDELVFDDEHLPLPDRITRNIKPKANNTYVKWDLFVSLFLKKLKDLKSQKIISETTYATISSKLNIDINFEMSKIKTSIRTPIPEQIIYLFIFFYAFIFFWLPPTLWSLMGFVFGSITCFLIFVIFTGLMSVFYYLKGIYDDPYKNPTVKGECTRKWNHETACRIYYLNEWFMNTNNLALIEDNMNPVMVRI